MAKSIDITAEPKETLSMNPRKFLMWLFIVSIVMIFAAFTSAYLVRKAEGNWREFVLPVMFTYSTFVLLLSSVSMHFSLYFARKDMFNQLKVSILVTFILGCVFLYMQFIGWVELVNINVFWVGNPSGSFVYVLSGIHGLHLISGLVVLCYALVSAFKLNIHSKSLVQIENCTTYWHFLDGLWLYLFLFLLYNS